MKKMEKINSADGIESYAKNPLDKAYTMIHGEGVGDLEDWQKAQRIIEVLGDSNWLPNDLSKECLYNIVHAVSYPDDNTRIKIILHAEEKARDIFQELSGIEEVHMDQIEYVYNKWKAKKES